MWVTNKKWCHRQYIVINIHWRCSLLLPHSTASITIIIRYWCGFSHAAETICQRMWSSFSHSNMLKLIILYIIITDIKVHNDVSIEWIVNISAATRNSRGERSRDVIAMSANNQLDANVNICFFYSVLSLSLSLLPSLVRLLFHWVDDDSDVLEYIMYCWKNKKLPCLLRFGSVYSSLQ